MNKKVKAQITVYAALSVFLVITLICTCIRSAAVSAGRVRVEMASVLSMEAVFAGYSVNYWKNLISLPCRKVNSYKVYFYNI